MKRILYLWLAFVPSLLLTACHVPLKPYRLDHPAIVVPTLGRKW